MFKPHKIYIQIRRNQVTAINLVTGEEVMRQALTPFSTPRVVLASFGPAEETIKAALRDLPLKRRFLAMNVIIQQMEGADGGLSDIEKRALRDIAEMAGANKVYIFEGIDKLSIPEALALIEKQRK